ncbi:MAG: ABC transporter substrate-binding protein, partial [Betaproteobacteria bacterium HGW-Betaproteobacteria-17]
MPLFAALPRRILHAFAHTARRLLWAVLLIAGIPPAISADKPLNFGVFPHLTARQTVETYRPLADVVEKHLQRQV